MKYQCEICGHDTSMIDYDYLVGTNHLACELAKDKKGMKKIENWNKINGITYKGYSISTATHHSNGTYRASIYNMDRNAKRHFEYKLIGRFNADNEFVLAILGTMFCITMPLENVRTFSNVVRTIESLIEFAIDDQPNTQSVPF